MDEQLIKWAICQGTVLPATDQVCVPFRAPRSFKGVKMPPVRTNLKPSLFGDSKWPKLTKS